MNLQPQLSPALASILRSARDHFNDRFANARRLHPDLDPGTFSEFVRTAVDDLAQAVERVRPDRLAEVVMAAYDAGLELVAQKLAGPGSHHPWVEDAWRRVLPRAAALVASEPARLIAAFCNAAHQLAVTAGARPGEWIQILETLVSQCADVEMLLTLGQVVAWRAGLAHFRQSAIAAADRLPESFALSAVGAKAGLAWKSVRERLLANPWFDPGGPEDASLPKIMTRAGSFRGFGGFFLEPPLVTASGEHFLVRSGDSCWLLTADRFGATFHRAPLAEFVSAFPSRRLPRGLQVDAQRIVFNGSHLELPDFGELTSSAANGATLTLTARLTHSIILVALL